MYHLDDRDQTLFKLLPIGFMIFNNQISCLHEHLSHHLQALGDGHVFKRDLSLCSCLEHQDMREHIIDQGGIDLDADTVLGQSDQVLHAHYTFQVPEEKLDLPAQGVNLSDQVHRIELVIQDAGQVKTPTTFDDFSHQAHVMFHFGIGGSGA